MQTQFIRRATALAVAALLAGAPAFAQTAAAPVDGLAMGEELTPSDAPGSVYIRETSGDWEVRCQRAPEGQVDPCNLYQLLRDETGNAVSEITMFAMPPGQQAAAGAQIITPLQTLLTQQVTLSVDGGPAKRYPFAFCTEVGCFAQVGFTAEDVSAFRRGARATLTIVPAGAPDGTTVDLTLSLTGFTAGFAVLESVVEEAMKQAGDGQ